MEQNSAKGRSTDLLGRFICYRYKGEAIRASEIIIICVSNYHSSKGILRKQEMEELLNEKYCFNSVLEHL